MQPKRLPDLQGTQKFEESAEVSVRIGFCKEIIRKNELVEVVVEHLNDLFELVVVVRMVELYFYL